MKNLLAEMTRYGVTISDIRQAISCADSTARSKTDKGTFTIGEAMKIRDTFFPGLRLEYLFANDDEQDDNKSA